FYLRDSVSRLSPLILFLGFLIHTAALGLHFFQSGYAGVNELREAVSFYNWLMVAVYLLIQLKYRLTVLGSICALLAFLMPLVGCRDPRRKHVGGHPLWQLLVLGSAADLIRHCLALLRHLASWTDYRGVERTEGRASDDGRVRRGHRLFSVGGFDLP